MKMNVYRSIIFLSSISLLLCFPACNNGGNDADSSLESFEASEKYEKPVEVDLPEIRKKGKLVAITSYGMTSYFLYRGQPMGYEYELLKRLAEHLDLELEIKVAYNMDQLTNMLNRGEGDIIAHNLTITQERQQYVNFTEHHTTTQQVLVQRKPENWRKMKVHNIEETLIRDPLKLIGTPVHVREESSYFERLKNLSNEMGGDINIQPIDGKLTTSEIIRKVAEGEIDYTVADRHIAELNDTYYDNLDVETALSFNQRLAWAVRKTSPELLQAVNDWISSMKNDVDYYVIYNKYFKNKKSFVARADSEFFSKKGNKISTYDELIKKYAEKIEWDWRLLASQIYQESQFDPKTKSWAGARGLMQVMPRTASQFGKYELYNPKQNIEVGVKFIQYVSDLYEDIEDPDERMKFILATYNVGQGHVADARRLAEKYGKDPDVWTDNVDKYILLKSYKEYYQDDVVKYGYCRGQEPYNYVTEILKRYKTYKEFISDEEEEDKLATVNS